MEAAAGQDVNLRSYNTSLLALGGFIASALLYFFFYGSTAPKLLAGSHFILWQNTQACANASAVKSCTSDSFIAEQPLAALRYQLADDAKLLVSVLPAANVKRPLVKVILSKPQSAWGEAVFTLPLDKQLRLKVDVEGEGAFFVHQRLSFYFDPEWQIQVGDNIAALLLSLAASAFLVWYLLSFESFGGRHFYLLIFFASVATQMRLSAFFQWDEWDAILKIMNQGFSSIFTLHNQHFIPLFFGLIYAQLKLIHDSYLVGLVLSHAIHAANAYLFALLLSKLQGSQRITKSAVVSAMLFAISLLHGEVLGWWFGQCTLMFLTAMLLSALSGLDYIRNANNKELIYCVVFALFAPLSFGNGFSVLLYLPAVLAAATALHFSDRLHWMRVLKVCVIAGIAVVVCGAMYALLQSGAEHIEKPQSLSRLLNEGLGRFSAYIAVGSQAGAVLRGLWILPGFSPGQVYQSFPSGLEGVLSPVSYSSALGLLVTILISAFAVVCGAELRRTLVFWLLGQTLLVSPFILTALGRWHEEITYALFLRYSYSALPGLIILAVPLIEQAAKRKSSGGVLLLLAYFCAQLYHGPQYSHVYKYGEASSQWAARIRETIQIAADSQLSLSDILKSDRNPYSPVPPAHLPGIHPDSYTIFRALNFVNHARYPEKNSEKP
ncbi:MAG: hypothetical protein KDD66_05435 [Bdellovibrionales bacterium]|nr:hypothetical protein [Bdellovibrionales bacterium]